jgi:Cu+-exporting ATPase
MTAIDPVCNMMVEERGTKFTSVHGEKIYYFCAAGCKSEFDSDPGKYMK